MMQNLEMKNRFAGQAGLSLVELLVAMTISLIILGGVYQIFVSSSTSSRENEQFARLQENARFALEVIGRDIRMAGYAGCAGENSTPVNRLDTGSINYDANAHGFIDTVNDSVDAVAGVDVSGNSVLTLRGIPATDFMYVSAGTANSVTLGSATGLATGDIVMVSDCADSDIVQITSIATNTVTFADNTTAPPTGPGNTTGFSLGKSYAAPAEVVEYQTAAFNLQGTPQGLFRQVGTAAAQEIVENVERMIIRYALDTDGDGDLDMVSVAGVPTAYVLATDVPDWTQVVAVRVGLLLQSDASTRTPEDTAAYDVDGDGTADYNDVGDERRIRRVFRSTFALRNRAS